MKVLKFCWYLIKDYTDILEKLLFTIVIMSVLAPFIALCFSFMAMVYTAVIVLSLYGMLMLGLIIAMIVDDIKTEYMIFETDDEKIISILKGHFKKC